MGDITYRGRIVQRWGARFLIVEKLNGPYASQKEELHEMKIQGRGTWGEIRIQLQSWGFSDKGWKRFEGAGELRSMLTKI